MIQLLFVSLQVVSNEQSCSYMWELGVDYSVSVTPALKLEFGVEYWTPNSQPQTVRTYRCTFDLNDYKVSFALIIIIILSLYYI